MKNQSGQILLIVVLLSTVLLTIGFSVSQITTQETQIAKLEEESKKAFAAAEAGLDRALKEVPVAGGSILISFEGVTGMAEVQSTQGTTFTTPLLRKDEQYTFYLADYPGFVNPWSGGDLKICFGSDVALELTLIKQDYSIIKYAVNPTSTSIISNASSASSVNPDDCPTDFNFTNKYPISSADISNSRLLIGRVMANSSISTKIGFKGPANFPIQGKTITSSATTSTGVSKKIQLFQSYPQIPADFFVTSF